MLVVFIFSFFFFLFLFWDMVSLYFWLSWNWLCRPIWPWSLEIWPASASVWVLELKAHASTVWLWFLFKSINFCFECKLHVCVLIWRPEEGMESPGAGGTDGCLLPDVCAQNQRRGPLESRDCLNAEPFYSAWHMLLTSWNRLPSALHFVSAFLS